MVICLYIDIHIAVFLHNELFSKHLVNIAAPQEERPPPASHLPTTHFQVFSAQPWHSTSFCNRLSSSPCSSTICSPHPGCHCPQRARGEASGRHRPLRHRRPNAADGVIRQDEGGVKEELLLAWKSIFNFVLPQETGGGDTDQGAEEVFDSVLTGWHTHLPPPNFSTLRLGLKILDVYSNVCRCEKVYHCSVSSCVI